MNVEESSPEIVWGTIPAFFCRDLSENCQCPGRNLKWAPPYYKSEAILLEPPCWVLMYSTHIFQLVYFHLLLCTISMSRLSSLSLLVLYCVSIVSYPFNICLFMSTSSCCQVLELEFSNLCSWVKELKVTHMHLRIIIHKSLSKYIWFTPFYWSNTIMSLICTGHNSIWWGKVKGKVVPVHN
jgi:hypothetical protein